MARSKPTASAKTPAAPETPDTAAPKTARRKPAADEAAKKPKLVRDSFTIPKNEYTVLDTLKQRAIQLTQPAKKSEILRAGIRLLHALPDEAFLAALTAVPSLKTGRPKQTPAEAPETPAPARVKKTPKKPAVEAVG